MSREGFAWVGLVLVGVVGTRMLVSFKLGAAIRSERRQLI